MRTGALMICAAASLLAAVPTPARAAPATFTFPPGGIIQSVLVTNSTPCAGQPFLITVIAQHPTNPQAPVEVYIDGAPGRPQSLQYFAVNPQKKVSIYAITRERLEDRKEITIDVKSCPLVTSSLELLHSRNPYHSNRVDFQAVLRGGRGRAYFWTFGDGTTATTTTPFVSHDYSSSLQPNDKYTYYNVTVVETSSKLITARRIGVGSSFVLSRSMGFVQADVRTKVTKTGVGFVVDVDIANHHSTSITLNRYLKHYLPCDYREPNRTEFVAAESVLGVTSAIVHPPNVKSPGLVTIPRNGSVSNRFTINLEDVPAEACAIGVNLIGTARDRLPVYGSYYLKVRQNAVFTKAVTDKQTLLALEQLGVKQLLSDPDRVLVDQLYELRQRGLITRTPSGWSPQ